MTQPTPRARQSGSAQDVTLTVAGRLEADDVLALCDALRDAAAHHSGERVTCDVRDVVRPHIGTVGSLARLALVSRRLGQRFEVRGAPSDLRELLELAGLDCLEGSAGEVVGQPEEREVALRVEEERDRGDSIA